MAEAEHNSSMASPAYISLRGTHLEEKAEWKK